MLTTPRAHAFAKRESLRAHSRRQFASYFSFADSLLWPCSAFYLHGSIFGIANVFSLGNLRHASCLSGANSSSYIAFPAPLKSRAHALITAHFENRRNSSCWLSSAQSREEAKSKRSASALVAHINDESLIRFFAIHNLRVTHNQQFETFIFILGF